MTAYDITIVQTVSELTQKVLKDLEGSDLGIASQSNDDREVLVDTVILDTIKERING